jgi:hypothetical protein
VRSCFGSSMTSFDGPSSMICPAVEHQRAVAHLAGEAHLVGHDQHGEPVGGQGAQHVEHLAHPLRIERAGGLVQQQDLRVHRKGPGDGDALLLAARHLVGIGALAVGEAHPSEEFTAALGCLREGQLLHVHRRLDDVAEGGAVGEEVPLLEDHPDALAHPVERRAVDPRAARDEHVPADGDAPAVEGLQPVEAAQEGALAAARGAHQGDHLALLEGRRDAPEDGPLSVDLAQLVDLDHERASLASSRCARSDRG